MNDCFESIFLSADMFFHCDMYVEHFSDLSNKQFQLQKFQCLVYRFTDYEDITYISTAHMF